MKPRFLEMTHESMRWLVVMVEEHADLQDPSVALIVVGKGVDREHGVALTALEIEARQDLIVDESFAARLAEALANFFS